MEIEDKIRNIVAQRDKFRRRADDRTPSGAFASAAVVMLNKELEVQHKELKRVKMMKNGI